MGLKDIQCRSFERGKRFMTGFVYSVKKSFYSSSPFTIHPNTDYRKNLPKSSAEAMGENWKKTGSSLRKAMKKVGEEIGQKE